MWDGSVKMSQDIKIGDILIGDDGEKRIVEDLVSGIDDLYEIKQKSITKHNNDKSLDQNKNTNYTVNSKHTLVLKTKDLNVENINDIILMTIDDYLKLNIDEKKELFGYKIYRLKSDIDTYKEYILTEIHIDHVGKGKYYGWTVNHNNRFILDDFTVVKNCDQMWCTQCHTAFSWKTGKFENKIHNPHYYEWQRKNNNGEAPRNPGDIECGRELSHNTCEQLQIASRRHKILYEIQNAPSTYSRYGMTRQIFVYNDKINFICEIIRNTLHNIHVILPTYQTDHMNKNQDLRVKYLEKHLDEDDFKILIQRNDKKHRKNTELSQVIQLSVTALTDIIYRLIDILIKQNITDENQLNIFITEIGEMQNYCNNILKEISFTYSTVQYGFNDDFRFIRVEKERKPRKPRSEKYVSSDEESGDEKPY